MVGAVATLGVVAGLLAAAVPASAQSLPGMIGVTTPHGGPGHHAATSEVFELNTFGGNDTLAARGTQVGSEGVKAPTMADDQMNVSGYNVKAAAVVVLIGANNDGFAETSPLGGGA